MIATGKIYLNTLNAESNNFSILKINQVNVMVLFK